MKSVLKLVVILVVVVGLIGGIYYWGNTPSDDQVVLVKESAETAVDSLTKSPIEEDSVLRYLIKG